MITIFYNTLLLNDAPDEWDLYYQYDNIAKMERLTEIQVSVVFYLILILIGVGWVLLPILINFYNWSSLMFFLYHPKIMKWINIIYLILLCVMTLMNFISFYSPTPLLCEGTPPNEIRGSPDFIQGRNSYEQPGILPIQVPDDSQVPFNNQVPVNNQEPVYSYNFNPFSFVFESIVPEREALANHIHNTPLRLQTPEDRFLGINTVDHIDVPPRLRSLNELATVDGQGIENLDTRDFCNYPFQSVSNSGPHILGLPMGADIGPRQVIPGISWPDMVPSGTESSTNVPNDTYMGAMIPYDTHMGGMNTNMPYDSSMTPISSNIPYDTSMGAMIPYDPPNVPLPSSFMVQHFPNALVPQDISYTMGTQSVSSQMELGSHENPIIINDGLNNILAVRGPGLDVFGQTDIFKKSIIDLLIEKTHERSLREGLDNTITKLSSDYFNVVNLSPNEYEALCNLMDEKRFNENCKALTLSEKGLLSLVDSNSLLYARQPSGDSLTGIVEYVCEYREFKDVLNSEQSQGIYLYNKPSYKSKVEKLVYKLIGHMHHPELREGLFKVQGGFVDSLVDYSTNRRWHQGLELYISANWPHNTDYVPTGILTPSSVNNLKTWSKIHNMYLMDHQPGSGNVTISGVRLPDSQEWSTKVKPAKTYNSYLNSL